MTGQSGSFGGQKDRRQFGRRDTFLRGTVVTEDGVSLPCTIVNVSDGGAALRMTGDAEVPDTFFLVVQSDDMIVSCRVAHRTDGKIGIAYISMPRRASSFSWEKLNQIRAAVNPLIRKGNRGGSTST